MSRVEMIAQWILTAVRLQLLEAKRKRRKRSGLPSNRVNREALMSPSIKVYLLRKLLSLTNSHSRSSNHPLKKPTFSS